MHRGILRSVTYIYRGNVLLNHILFDLKKRDEENALVYYVTYYSTTTKTTPSFIISDIIDHENYFVIHIDTHILNLF